MLPPNTLNRTNLRFNMSSLLLILLLVKVIDIFSSSITDPERSTSLFYCAEISCISDFDKLTRIIQQAC